MAAVIIYYNSKPLSKEKIVEEINELYSSGDVSWDGFCSISGNTVSIDNGCGSCGHGSWEIGSVSYQIKYELTRVRQSEPTYRYNLVVTCKDGTSCISISPNYAGNEGIYGDPWNELRIGFDNKEFAYKLLDLLNKLSKTMD
jgi:hypothetical protein